MEREIKSKSGVSERESEEGRRGLEDMYMKTHVSASLEAYLLPEELRSRLIRVFWRDRKHFSCKSQRIAPTASARYTVQQFRINTIPQI